ncbi:MAG: ATP-binding cassette domain-containing protein [Candidatus Poribacteria bacterium]|nr:ATP-binding cassette domain-containing protein [Candidatus Poribacteria bacterium]MDE0505455.1 ATP-binding cassette domain-containing protein [Candidatus Poribacteria bacterium]
MPVISVEHLCKDFKVHKRRKGFWGSLSSTVTREYDIIKAVEDVNFTLERGELVGYIGANGAGKSTTIKMLTGILVPTSGHIDVMNLTPYLHRKENARRIGVVFGQRTQLWWDLPVIDSFELLKHIYEIPENRYKHNLEFFSELLQLRPFLCTPVRKLSLGQRMRCDLTAALLHDPEILYLDEPTIGLDVVAKEQVRQFLKQINAERQVTVILTTHDLNDVEQVCGRLIIIDKGKLIYDGGIDALKNQYGKTRMLIVDLAQPYTDIDLEAVSLTRREENRIWLAFDRDTLPASEVISQLTSRYEVRDLTISEPEIEEIVRRIYKFGMSQ